MKKQDIGVTDMIRVAGYLGSVEKAIELASTAATLDKAYCIKFRGKMIKFRNNKSVWAKEQFALSALRNKVYRIFESIVEVKDKGLNGKDRRKLYGMVIQKLREDRILEVVEMVPERTEYKEVII